jgi:hypothetical protein
MIRGRFQAAPFLRSEPLFEQHPCSLWSPKLAIRTIEQNRDLTLDIKIRLSVAIAEDHDLGALRLTPQAAEAHVAIFPLAERIVSLCKPETATLESAQTQFPSLP